jgi:hypothetical protein
MGPAPLSCNKIVCPTAGAVVKLKGSCTSGVAGGVISYEIDGKRATSYTCPHPKRPTIVTATVSKDGCQHTADFEVASEDKSQALGGAQRFIDSAPPASLCRSQHPVASDDPAFAQNVAAHPPSIPRNPALETLSLGTCWSDQQAQPFCDPTRCKPGESVALNPETCNSEIKDAGTWTFAPAGPVTCPASGKLTVDATLTVPSPLAGGGSCTFATTKRIVAKGERSVLSIP